MIPLAALTGPLPKAGVVAVSLLVAASLLSRRDRPRAVAMLGAVVLAPTLLLADIWHSPQLRLVHRHPLLAAAVAALALLGLAALAFGLDRRPGLLGLLALAALPFRIPIQAGGTTSNLLVPLYLVVGAGTLRHIARAISSRAEPTPRPAPLMVWLERVLALYVVAYALQATYSSDFEKALQQMAFFYVPFALLFCLLRELDWTPSLLRRALWLLVGLSILFALIAFAEYATKTVILNPKLVVQNDLHAYFTVNSVFFDPDIFGRFLALVMIVLVSALLFIRRPREQIRSVVALAVLWAGLLLTLSRSSLLALLLGMGALAALRWRLSRTLAATAAVVVVGVVVVAVSPLTFGLNQGLQGVSSGRAGLISGGVKIFSRRPLWGYGSGSFVREFRARHPDSPESLAASHATPLTVAAEQGLIGELVYAALVIVCLLALFARTRADPPRAAVAAAFLALVFHTLLYADFLEDPVAWTLLGIGVALASPRRVSASQPTASPAPLGARLLGAHRWSPGRPKSALG